MPTAAARPCRHTGCGALVTDGSGRCQKHKVAPGSFADKSRGSRHERGYGTAWNKIRVVILKRDSGLCQPCLAAGRVTVATQVDHIIPRAQGGTDTEDNLRSICKACHQAKTDREKNVGR